MQHKRFNFASFVSISKQQKPQIKESLKQNFRSSFDGLIKSVVEEKACECFNLFVLSKKHQNYTNSFKGRKYLFANKSLYSK